MCWKLWSRGIRIFLMHVRWMLNDLWESSIFLSSPSGVKCSSCTLDGSALWICGIDLNKLVTVFLLSLWGIGKKMYDGESSRSFVNAWCETWSETKSQQELGLPEPKAHLVSDPRTPPAPSLKARPTTVTLLLPSNLGPVCRSVLVKSSFC